MTSTILRTYDRLHSAERARAALRDAGFHEVQVSALADEAGPAEGNFVSGNGAVSTGGNTAFAPAAVSGDAYRQDYQPVRDRAVNLLRITVQDDADVARVERVIEPFGGIDVKRRTP